jgi:hypothetical protein
MGQPDGYTRRLETVRAPENVPSALANRHLKFQYFWPDVNPDPQVRGALRSATAEHGTAIMLIFAGVRHFRP